MLKCWRVLKERRKSVLVIIDSVDRKFDVSLRVMRTSILDNFMGFVEQIETITSLYS